MPETKGYSRLNKAEIISLRDEAMRLVNRCDEVLAEMGYVADGSDASQPASSRQHPDYEGISPRVGQSMGLSGNVAVVPKTRKRDQTSPEERMLRGHSIFPPAFYPKPEKKTRKRIKGK